MTHFKVSKLLAVALLTLSGSAFAQTVNSGTFTVSVALTPVCSVKTAPGNISFGTYVPFTNAAVSTSTTIVYQCSQGSSPISVGLVNTVGTAGATTVSTAGTGAQTAVGVIRGLRSTLAIPSIATAGTAVPGAVATAGTAGAGGANSSAKEYSFVVSADMAGNQAGSFTTGDTSHTWQVAFVY
jgi:hypothetical protein